MPGPIELLKSAWGIYTANIRLFILIYLVPWVVVVCGILFFDNTVITTPNDYVEVTPFLFLFVLVSAVVNVLMGIAMILAVANPNELTVLMAYKQAKQYFWSYLLVLILTGLAVLAGLILFIIPGIIFSVWFAFAYFVLIFENKTGTEAMKQSKSYVKGKWFAVFGRMAFWILIFIILSFIVSVVTGGGTQENNPVNAIIMQLLNFILVPIAIAYMYLLYNAVKITPTSGNQAAPEQQPIQPQQEPQSPEGQHTMQ